MFTRPKKSWKLGFFLTLTVVAISGCDSVRTAGVPNDSVCSASAVGVYPEQATSPYVLPYSVGESYLVAQGNCTLGSHNAFINQQYAYDMIMPIGTTLVASRGGQVVAIEESFSDGTGIPREENYVVVLHEDGSASRYIHVKHQGALVEVNDIVSQGDAVALSGHSGNSSEPHLHFEVMSGFCIPHEDEGCYTVPVNFSNTRSHVNGLVQGETYTAH